MACPTGQYVNPDTNQCEDYDFSFLNPYGSGGSSSPDDAPSDGMFTEEKDDKPKNGQVVLEQLPELVGGLFGGVAALINATNGTTPNAINNNYQNPDSDDDEKEDKTAAYVLGAVGLILVLVVVFFVIKSVKSKGVGNGNKRDV